MPIVIFSGEGDPTLAVIADGLSFADLAQLDTEELFEALGMGDSLSDLILAHHTAADGFDAADLSRATLLNLVADALDVSGLSRVALILQLADTMDWAEAVEYTSGLSVRDGIYIFDNLFIGWCHTLADGLDLADAAGVIAGLVIAENLRLSESWTATGAFAHSTADGFFISDAAAMNKLFRDTVAESVAMSDALTELFAILVKEIFDVSDAAAAVGAFQHSAKDAFTLADAVGFLFDLLIEDGFSATDAAALKWVIYAALTDGFSISETLTEYRGFSESLADGVDITDAATIAQVLALLIEDGLGLELEIEVEGELWQALVLNTDSVMPSVYSNYGFNSFCVYQGAAYGAKSDGIYKLEGTTDAGSAIKTGVVFPETAWQTHLKKRVRTARLGVSGTAPVIRFETDDGDAATYTIERTHVNPSRSHKGVRWTIKLADFDAVDFVEIVPVFMVR